MNRITIVGRLVRDPNLRFTNNGLPVCNMTVAVDRNYGDGTDFIDVVAWKKRAEVAAKYLSKGREVAIHGSLQIRKNEKNGKTYKNHEIIADQIKFLSGKSEQKKEDKPKQKPKEDTEEVRKFPGPGSEDIDESSFDIPF